MKRFALVAMLAAMLFSVASSASATELKVKGNLDVYGMWSSNLKDFDSDYADGDNFFAVQRMRTYFTFQAHENLKAVLGLEMDEVWGQEADWGTDATGDIEVKHAYLDFNFPDTAINVKAGMQYVALPGIFGNPVFDDDAAALMVSAPINDMFGLAVGYTRGVDGTSNVQDNLFTDGVNKDDIDAAMLLAPITLDGFNVTPYFAYAWMGANAMGFNDDATVWVLGANAALTMFDPFTLEADLMYGALDSDDYETKGWYAALAASYKFDFMTAALFGTYATGASDDAGEDDYMPTLSEDWGMTPYIGGARAFNAADDSFATDALGVGFNNSDGTGLWTIGVAFKDISFVENLSHDLTIAYARGTSDENSAEVFDEDSSAWEIWFVNKYMIYENLAAISELGFLAPDLEDYDDTDNSYFMTVGFQYKF